MRLTQGQIRKQLADLEGWKLRKRRITRLFTFEDFSQGMRFVNRVARLAESANHHPDINIRYNRVMMSLTTHDEGGLTMRDFKMARRINKIRT